MDAAIRYRIGYMAAQTFSTIVINRLSVAPETNDAFKEQRGLAITYESIMFSWHERDGPPVAAPAKKGFGSKLIRNALPSGDAKVKIHYLPKSPRSTVVFKSVGEH